MSLLTNTISPILFIKLYNLWFFERNQTKPDARARLTGPSFEIYFDTLNKTNYQDWGVESGARERRWDGGGSGGGAILELS